MNKDKVLDHKKEAISAMQEREKILGHKGMDFNSFLILEAFKAILEGIFREC